MRFFGSDDPLTVNAIVAELRATMEKLATHAENQNEIASRLEEDLKVAKDEASRASRINERPADLLE